VFRYALGNLFDFNPETDAIPVADMLEIDQWILLRAEELVAKCRGWYDEFAFHKVYRAVYDFTTTDLSAIYFDISKDRLYTAAPRSVLRRSAQTAMHRIIYALVRLLSPLLSFTAEEVWGYLCKPADSPASVHLALFPEAGELTSGLTIEQRRRLTNWEPLMAARDQVLKALESARADKLIGKSLEARVHLRVGADLYPLLEEYRDELPALFIVSQVVLEKSGEPSMSVEIERAEGDKCERCWKYMPEVGKNAEFPTLCQACQDVVRGLGSE